MNILSPAEPMEQQEQSPLGYAATKGTQEFMFFFLTRIAINCPLIIHIII